MRCSKRIAYASLFGMGLAAIAVVGTGCARVPVDSGEDWLHVPDWRLSTDTRSGGQRWVDRLSRDFWIRRLTERGLGDKKLQTPRNELSPEEQAIVADAEREDRVYTRYLILLYRSRAEGESVADLEKRAFSAEELLDEVLPKALRDRDVATFERLLDWVPPSLRQSVANPEDPDADESEFLRSFGGGGD